MDRFLGVGVLMLALLALAPLSVPLVSAFAVAAEMPTDSGSSLIMVSIEEPDTFSVPGQVIERPSVVRLPGGDVPLGEGAWTVSLTVDGRTPAGQLGREGLEGRILGLDFRRSLVLLWPESEREEARGWLEGGQGSHVLRLDKNEDGAPTVELRLGERTVRARLTTAFGFSQLLPGPRGLRDGPLPLYPWIVNAAWGPARLGPLTIPAVPGAELADGAEPRLRVQDLAADRVLVDLGAGEARVPRATAEEQAATLLHRHLGARLLARSGRIVARMSDDTTGEVVYADVLEVGGVDINRILRDLRGSEPGARVRWLAALRKSDIAVRLRLPSGEERVVTIEGDRP